MRKTSVKTGFLIKVLFLFIIQGLDWNSDDGVILHIGKIVYLSLLSGFSGSFK